MKNLIVLVITGLTFFSCKMEKKSIELLFLGHASQHHDAQEYATAFGKYLSEENINLTFAYSPEVLMREYLRNFDVLLIYANHKELTSSQEGALLNFVSAGGGFMPIHSASACFSGSDKYVELVGGRFESHGVDSFKTDIIKEHPVLEGISPFYVKDETYVHTDLNPEKEILMMREEEPWTWVRNYGNGKIFYTAYGHDENTWEHPSFKKLLRNAIIWTTGIQPKQRVKKEYKQAKFPNYRGVEPEPQYQLPLSVEESLALTALPPGFSMKLFASEPDIVNPIAFNWDEKGRLWVIETVDYPNVVRESGGLDKIKILEDTDRDGKADQITVFADSLNVPTGLTFVNGGVLVSAAPEFYFLKDTNNDDKADIREKVLPGWGVRDTHAGPSNLKYGLDNRVWGTVGYSAYDNNDINFTMGAYRIPRDFSSPEFISKFTNNTWGLGFNESFDVFGSTANNTHSIHVAVPNRYLEGMKGINWFGNKKIDGHYAVRPRTDKFLQVDVFDGFTAAAGHNIYTAGEFPQGFRNKIAFVCEPTVHLVHMAKLKKDGSTYRESDGWNIVASSDEWFSPVHAETGPDGALWIADWYNFIVQHNPTPEGFENGTGNAYVQPLRDKEHGRIYRIEWEGGNYKKNYPDLSSKEDLLKTLGHDNLFWRMTAQRLMVESGDSTLKGELTRLLHDLDEKMVLHAMGTLYGLNLIEEGDEYIEGLATHRNAAVRKNAIQLIGDMFDLSTLIERNNLINDPDPGVRLAALSTLRYSDISGNMAKDIVEMALEEERGSDPFISQALYAAMTGNTAKMVSFVRQQYPEKFVENEDRTDFEAFSFDDSRWKKFYVPRQWDSEIKDFVGEIWFRTAFEVSDNRGNYTLHLGPIDENDITYINGVEIGKMTDQQWTTPRHYKVPEGVLKKGRNILAIKVENKFGTGGIYGKPGDVYIDKGNNRIDLAGNWHYKILTNKNPASSLFKDEDILSTFLKNYSGGEVMAELSTMKEQKSREVVIKAVKFKIQFDKKKFTVKPGEKITLKLVNDDVMRHNLLISVPGSLEAVGKAADKLATNPKGAELNWVPDIDEVLFSTELVDAGGMVTLEFTAPEEKGIYPFVCTFPGHWRTMNGVMIVE